MAQTASARSTVPVRAPASRRPRLSSPNGAEASRATRKLAGENPQRDQQERGDRPARQGAGDTGSEQRGGNPREQRRRSRLLEQARRQLAQRQGGEPARRPVARRFRHIALHPGPLRRRSVSRRAHHGPRSVGQQGFRHSPLDHLGLQRDSQQGCRGVAVGGELGKPFHQPALHHQRAGPGAFEVDPFEAGGNALRGGHHQERASFAQHLQHDRRFGKHARGQHQQVIGRPHRAQQSVPIRDRQDLGPRALCHMAQGNRLGRGAIAEQDDLFSPRRQREIELPPRQRFACEAGLAPVRRRARLSGD
ncbi:MAG: hypothetical protein BGO08_04205 [Altererythrobacter sp. 66-12]|nr:MAG: hypothetical protein BGO08_04205 [Altererythrobacter sp. 66-12]